MFSFVSAVPRATTLHAEGGANEKHWLTVGLAPGDGLKPQSSIACIRTRLQSCHKEPQMRRALVPRRIYRSSNSGRRHSAASYHSYIRRVGRTCFFEWRGTQTARE